MTSIPTGCALYLQDVLNQLQFCKQATPELPLWLARVQETARDYLKRTPENDRTAIVAELVTALEAFDVATDGGARPTASAAGALWPILEKTHAAFVGAPDHEHPRSLTMARHSLVNVLIPFRLTTSEVLTEKLVAALAALQEEDAAHPLGAELRRCVQAVAGEITPEVMGALEAVLSPLRGAIKAAVAPVVPVFNGAGSGAPLRAVLIVEDQWWGDALEQKVRAALPPQIPVHRARTLKAAVGALGGILNDSLTEKPTVRAERGEDDEAPARGLVEDESDEWTELDVKRETEITTRRREAGEQIGDVLVFLDLGLPADEAALASGQISRAHGKGLLVQLRDYQINARTIVLTSPSEYLPDHQWISQQGIAPEDFILKTDSEWDKEIDDALRRALEHSRTVRRVELDEATNLAWLDGIEIGFAPLDFKIVSILCENLKDKPEPQHRRYAFSCAEIAARLDDYFHENCAAENVPTHIHTIRRTIHERFNAVGRAADAHRIIATAFYGDEVRYQIVAGQFLHKGQSTLPVVPAVSLLVVEDNEAWRDAIAAPLRQAGYEVATAADVTGAVAAVMSLSPTVLCVDMELPVQTGEVGDEEGGLRVIEQVRAIDPEARVVVLTDLAQHDRLRVEATRRGVWIHDYIHKADEDWKWKLHRSIWRLAREWQQGVDLSQSALRSGHVVELSRSQPRDFWVDGAYVHLAVKRAVLLRALAECVDRRVSSNELQAIVYADKTDDKDRSNALASMVNDVRSDIQSKAAEAGRAVNAKHIIAEESGGYILCGPVLYRA